MAKTSQPLQSVEIENIRSANETKLDKNIICRLECRDTEKKRIASKLKMHVIENMSFLGRKQKTKTLQTNYNTTIPVQVKTQQERTRCSLVGPGTVNMRTFGGTHLGL